MGAILNRASLAAAALSCLLVTPAAFAQATAGPWARVPASTTLCYQSTGSEDDPFYAKLEAARAAIQSDKEKQEAINARIEQEFFNIDPMEMASRMQQWMMSNPQEAAKYMQAAQAAPAQAQADIASAAQHQQAQEAAFNALVKSWEDARIQAYAPVEGRRKALAAKMGYAYSADREALAKAYAGFYSDPSTSRADMVEGESINGALDQAYKALCPQWWGANGKAQAYLKTQKDWFVRERIPYLEKSDAAKLQQFAMMSTPAATYRSTAAYQAVDEYLALVRKVYDVRDVTARCAQARDCDGAYP